MIANFLDSLQCSFCGSSLEFSNLNSENEHGILNCTGCSSDFPVVFGIPIIKASYRDVDISHHVLKSYVLQKGPRVGTLVRQLKEGRFNEVEKSLLVPQHLNPVFLSESWYKATGKKYGSYLNKLALKFPFVKGKIHKKNETFFNKLRNESTAVGFLRHYFSQVGEDDLMNFFIYHFGQPRFLTAISLATELLEGDKPVLDLACGTGHLIHFLKHQNPKREVIGLDRNFGQLYIAKKFIAPNANYICAEADEKLPLKNDFFSGVLSIDSFHMFLYKLTVVHEMKRIIKKDGVLIFSRVANSLQEPQEGHNIPFDYYKSLLAEMPNIALGEDMVLEMYLQKSGPDLSNEPGAEELRSLKWLSLVASNNDQIFKEHGKFNEWPHAFGELQINPLYHEIERDDAGNVNYQFRYPSEWYEFEDHGWTNYAPEQIQLPKKVLDALENKIRIPEMGELIEKYVLLGMSENYLELE